jgi:hypothetical protein
MITMITILFGLEGNDRFLGFTREQFFQPVLELDDNMDDGTCCFFESWNVFIPRSITNEHLKRQIVHQRKRRRRRRLLWRFF